MYGPNNRIVAGNRSHETRGGKQIRANPANLFKEISHYLYQPNPRKPKTDSNRPNPRKPISIFPPIFPFKTLALARNLQTRAEQDVGATACAGFAPEEGPGGPQGSGQRRQLRLLGHWVLSPGHGFQPRGAGGPPPPIGGLRALPLRSEPLHGDEPGEHVQDAQVRRERRYHNH